MESDVPSRGKSATRPCPPRLRLPRPDRHDRYIFTAPGAAVSEITLRLVLVLRLQFNQSGKKIQGARRAEPYIYLHPLMAATAVASRKRGTAAAFLDDTFSFPGDLPPRLQAKRGRCSSSIVAADLGLSFPLEFDPVEALHLIFPGEDPQVRRSMSCNYLA